MKLRHEYKFPISETDIQVLRMRLGAVLQRDKYTMADGRYRVRSLYFDNLYDKALLEKLDGLQYREKFRIRLYNGDHSFIMLEKKSKYNNLSRKLQTRLRYDEVAQLIEGHTDWMPLRGDPLINELHARMKNDLLRPQTVVEYLREPFTYPAGNVRITIDSDIRTGILSKAFLDPDLTLLEAAPGEAVLEVKYDEYLPDLIRGLVNLGTRRASSFSKYAVSRRFG
ncbi:MAG: polyphosphate polymerase domain-containing protein [Clostridiales bacterium]|nr:polyphosphate polymerase domain-containing protein [Clostridiales bacterium]